MAGLEEKHKASMFPFEYKGLYVILLRELSLINIQV